MAQESDLVALRPVAVNILNASIAGCICSFVLLILKFLSRYRSKSPFGLDDVLVAISWIITVPLAVAFYEQGRHGLGYMPDELDHEVYLTQRKWFWASSWLYFLALGLSKLSVTLQFFRIFVTPKTLLVTKATIVFVTSWTIISVCVAAFECVPIEKYWDKSVQGTCINGKKTFYANGVFNILTDFIIIGIPVPSLLKLQVGMAKKMGLMVAFSLGLVVCAISIARIPMVVLHAGPGMLSLMTWSTVELHVAIICACLPSIRPLFVALLRFTGIDSYIKSASRTTGGKTDKGTGYGHSNAGNNTHISTYRRREEGRNGSTLEYIEMEEGVGENIQVQRTVEVKSEAYTASESRSRASDENSIDRLVNMPERSHTVTWR